MSHLMRTPLYNAYSTKAKLIDFWGWELPVQFSSIIDEHVCTRERVSLFDVSHMGEIIVQGKDSLSFLQQMITNDVSALKLGAIQYGFMCNENGGTIDDFLIYMLEANRYMLVVNASNIEKDLLWLQKHATAFKSVSIQNKSHELSLLAVQGPKAKNVVERIIDINITEWRPFTCKQHIYVQEIDANIVISRTGYTGEDGFELYVANDKSHKLWALILKVGKKEGILEAGLGARDTLRLEAGLPLYGQELTEAITPIEAGLSFAVKIKKKQSFIGKKSLQKQLINGPNKKIIGIEMIEKGIPRTTYIVYSTTNKEIGIITSGTYSPTLQKSIGFALIDKNYCHIGTRLFVKVRNRMLHAKVVETPFYRHNN